MSEHQTVIITGPSGSGKTTLVDHVCRLYPQYYHVPIGMSSRAMRPGETQGNPYIFTDEATCLTTPAFNRVRYLDNEYCLPLTHFVEDKINLVVLEVDGARRLRDEHPTIYIKRDENQLIRAIRDRNQPLSVEIARLAQLDHEICMADEFVHKLSNNNCPQLSVHVLDRLVRNLFGLGFF